MCFSKQVLDKEKNLDLLDEQVDVNGIQLDGFLYLSMFPMLLAYENASTLTLSLYHHNQLLIKYRKLLQA